MRKYALVTGASEGIGRAFALKLKEQEYLVTSVARSEEKLKVLVKELGSDHKYIVADLSSEKGQETVVKELETQRYSLLINNAGVGTVGNFTSVPIQTQLKMIQLNCIAVVRTA